MSSRPLYWYFPNVLNLKEIKKLNKFINTNYDKEEDKKLKAVDNNNNLKKFLTTYLIKYTKIKPFIKNIVDRCYRINRENFGYDLFKISEELDMCNYNIYSDNLNDRYDWHIDCSSAPYSDIKLTILINLSEKEFEGGDFYLQQTNDCIVNELRNIGSAIMFISHTRHRVTPVTKGIRKNLALFLQGPSFK
jgi:PKHD-type hydroxylase